MTYDLLDNFRPGILEAIVEYLLVKGTVDEETLKSAMAGTDEGRLEIRRSLQLLTQLKYLTQTSGHLVFTPGSILETGTTDDKPFSDTFLLDLLARITISTDSQIKFFREVLISVLDKPSFSLEELERFLSQARRDAGLSREASEKLSVKLSSCVNMLEYAKMIYPIQKGYVVTMPRTLMIGAIRRVFEERHVSSLYLFDDILHGIDLLYFPVLHRGEGRPLLAVEQSLGDPSLNREFVLEFVPDGGREMTIDNRRVNQISVRSPHAN